MANRELSTLAIAGFAQFKPGTHSWLDNNNRPFLNLTLENTGSEDIVIKPGEKFYSGMFLNKWQVSAPKATSKTVTVSVPTDLSHPLFKNSVKKS